MQWGPREWNSRSHPKQKETLLAYIVIVEGEKRKKILRTEDIQKISGGKKKPLISTLLCDFMAVLVGISGFDLRRPRIYGDLEINCLTIPSVGDYTRFLTTEVISPRA